MVVNGKNISLTEPITLEAFLLERSYDLRVIAVERNGQIIPKETYGEVILEDEDTIEIVRFVGGG